jgi:BirA family biotin operon repressor/biotin-[acetyl-CoA-carboxylase] ligase
MSDPLPPDLAAALRATADRRGSFGEPAYFFTEIGSTNDAAAALAEHGAPEGATVVASSQTAGRGRLGRDWFSPPGAGLYVSVVIRDPGLLPILPLAAGVAVAEGIRAATRLPVQLKWPNDVVIESGVTPPRRRKLAGVLAEGSTSADGLQHAVLGIGINLRPAAYPPEIADRATSIESELGRPPDAGAVLAETLCALAQCRAAATAGDAAEILRRWQELAPSARGAAVEWDGPEGRLTGVSAGIDDTGALLVRVSDRVERIISGEVRWL